ncbi:MFS transporter [Alloalcanivorax xenomutans]|jgi:MFS transporter, DHA1 family, inner membrane transport protein|uniref:MFS transporter n=1 Tax=Alloalcanivorax xenomutans TaxID=1094342 RepID=UPI0003B91FA6|nr:MFS transporter [Alloalcanivorax xenomutans]ERS10550.1 MFS transporter [Alcanivorax sp. PN-3]KYZ86511.1 MFS transporter [Alcanivorax sp. KX64203]MBA4722582.1 MFS transporter [Alcanivorax sp.]MCE7524666.1 MFS transporter [Alloalcanivorax xenomutans]PHS70383.1 MAG: MFS transporter [Alcanivorax sp.]
MSVQQPKAAMARHPRIAELALALGGFGIGTGEFVIMGLLNRVALDLQVDPQDVGYAISSYAMGVVVGAPIISTLAARVPRRALLIVLMLVFAVGNLASALAPGFWSFVALRFIAGLPHGAYFGVAALVAASAVPFHQRARAVARVMTGLTVAILLGAPLGTWAGNQFGWPVAFAGVGAIALLTALMVRIFVPMQPVDPHASPLRELSALLKHRVLFTLGIASIGFGGMFAVFSYVMPTLTEQAGMDESLGPLVLAIFGIGTILGTLAGARAADGNLMKAIPGILIWCAVIQGLFFVAANSMWWGLLFVGLVGTSMALGPALQTRLMDVAGDGQTMAASLNHAAFNLANALGAWLAGVATRGDLPWSTTGLVGTALALGGLLVFFAGRAVERATATPDR